MAPQGLLVVGPLTTQCLAFAARSPARLFPAGPPGSHPSLSPAPYPKDKRLTSAFFFVQTTPKQPESRQSSINLPEVQPLGASHAAAKNIHGAGTCFSPFLYFPALSSPLKPLSWLCHPSPQSSSLCEYPHQRPQLL